MNKALTYEQSFTEFHKRVVRLLALPVKSGPPKKAPVLYPPDQPPDLLVFIGDPDQAADVRSQLPASSFLFWIHPPVDDMTLPDELSRIENQRTLLCAADDWCEDKAGMLVAMLPEQQVRFVVGPGYTERYGALVTKIEKNIKLSIENTLNNLTRGLIRLRCSLHNLPAIEANSSRRPAPLKHKFPAIICSAGPSLSSQFDLLKQASQHTVIIAVGHAVRSMLNAGITPDIVVESDSQAYQNWPEEIGNLESALVANTEVSPEVAARFTRILWCAGSSPPFNMLMNKWGIKLASVQLSRTVSVSALDFAARSGFSPIALVGQDLCVGESGLTHVEETSPEKHDELIKIPGNNGNPVLTTPGLSAIRDSFQDYISNLSAAQLESKPEVVNCTHGGAVIEGLRHETLEDFIARIPDNNSKPDITGQEQDKIDITANLDRLHAGINKYRKITDDLTQCCINLKREITRPQMKMNRVRNHQEHLNRLIAEEATTRADESISLVVNPIVQYVDSIMKQTPGMISRDADPSAQLAFLRARFGFTRDICDDIIRDINQAVKSRKTSGHQNPEISPYSFNSFKQMAVDFITAGNPEFAGILAAWPENDYIGKFKIAWVNQTLPFVEKTASNGNTVPLSTFFTMHRDAALDLRKNFADGDYNADRHAVVFVAPGNWIHPFVFADTHPNARMMIVDPWPELLSAMISRGCFLHKMPRNTLVVGAHSKLPKWRSICANQFAEWKQQGLEVKFFTPPLVKKLPETQELYDTVKSLQ